MPLPAGTRLGRYEIRSQLGAGGMGEVYLARDTTELDREVAVKVLPAELAADADRMRRFVQEAKAASSLNHPNILTVHEVGEVNSAKFIATEYVEGETLRQRMTRPRLSLREALEIAIQIASALVAAHKAGVVHRDIKPENVMLRGDGIVKVVDFGLAKPTGRPTTGKLLADPEAVTRALVNTSPGMIMGTVAYMSPEQARGISVDERTDIWSLGVVLYEIVAGRLPFEGSTAGESLAAILGDKEVPPLARFARDVPAELERIVEKALRKDREERYQVIKDMLLDLRSLKQRLEFEAELERSVTPHAEAHASAKSATQAGMALGADNTGEAPARTLGRASALPWVIALASTLALALTVAGYLFRGHFFGQAPPEATVKQITLAVLPFRILNKDEAKEMRFLSLGFPDAIITRLANVRRIRLRPTSAILRYEDQDVDAKEAGRSLASDYVVMGTVQKAEERLRVNVQLLRASDGTPIWGERYDRPRAGLLDLQDSIAGQVAAALKIQMTAAEQERLLRRYTENTAAYELYLEGRSHLARSTQEEALAAVDKFEHALRLDPNFAPAHAGLARVAAEMHLRFAPEAEVKKWGERAELEARRASQLDTNLAETHLALAAVYGKTEFNWEGTIEESKQALELDPNLDLPYAYRARAFYHLGLMDLAARDVREGLAINTDNRNRIELLRTQGIIDMLNGEYSQALSSLEEAQRLNGAPLSDVYLAQAYYYQGGTAHAEKLLEELRRSPSASVAARAQATLSSFIAARGSRKQSEELLRAVIAGRYMDHHVAYSVGAAYAQLGQHNEALLWLRKAAGTGFPCHPWYARDPLLRPLGADREFQSFMAVSQKSWESAKVRYTLPVGSNAIQ